MFYDKMCQKPIAKSQKQLQLSQNLHSRINALQGFFLAE